ncbi:uncharacterized protein LOC120356777 [Solenopsis invicta]|uniref:uncharacterized protein LOC120356777 n=1 Tax=Solenopsis invicta TaxID=13686 RepID=UPI00193D2DC5|nr:uncharacterized protein LOC120356777 [Solenopsis invicta]
MAESMVHPPIKEQSVTTESKNISELKGNRFFGNRLITKAQLSKLNDSSLSKMACDLLGIVFDKKELRESCLTGKQALVNKNKHGNQAEIKQLDTARLADVEGIIAPGRWRLPQCSSRYRIKSPACAVRRIATIAATQVLLGSRRGENVPSDSGAPRRQRSAEWRILWRPETSDNLQEFRLNTVTYSLAYAPFLAMRTLRQLAVDEEIRFPHAAVVIQRDTYVDDILTGADTLDEARVLRDELTGLCAAGGFPLRKWAANSDAVLTDIPLEHRQVQDSRAWDADVEHFTLGLLWHPREDYFAFRIRPLDAGQVTKRIVLSQTTRLFDPMGWLSPVIIAAKILIQTLWLQQLEWDQPLDGTFRLFDGRTSVAAIARQVTFTRASTRTMLDTN